MTALSRLKNVKHSDNTCSVGWTNIWAAGWDCDTVALARYFCPRGIFCSTAYINSDTRRGFDERERREAKEYSQPIRVLALGAYFDFPMDTGALHLMQRLDLVNELMVLVAGGGRHRWPESTHV